MTATLAQIDPGRLAAANISPLTGLATDYLNHFNEVAMLADMLADMPDVGEEILAWAPRDYVAHFRITGYREADLVAEAYELADPAMRDAFAAACGTVEFMIADLQARVETGEPPETFASAAAAELYDAIGRISEIINGSAMPEVSSNQDDIDALFD
jgi:hypothetical protein